jgi:hypothetical protein
MVEKTEGLGNPESEETTEKTIAEEADEKTAELDEKETETSEESEETEAEEESSTSEQEETGEEEPEEDGLPEETDEVDLSEFLDADDKKSGYQKRVDSLIAENKTLKEQLNQRKPEKDTEYSDAELRKVWRKAREEGDHALELEAIEHMISNREKKAREEIIRDQQQAQKRAQRSQQEWASVLKSYAYLSDPKRPEIYKGSRKELNISSTTSLLHRLAVDLYNRPDMRDYYNHPGGSKEAVADALNHILKKRKGASSSNKETALLKKRLAKEKRKSSLGTGTPGVEETAPKRPLTDSERTAEYIEERKKQKQRALDSALK